MSGANHSLSANWVSVVKSIQSGVNAPLLSRTLQMYSICELCEDGVSNVEWISLAKLRPKPSRVKSAIIVPRIEMFERWLDDI